VGVGPIVTRGFGFSVGLIVTGGFNSGAAVVEPLVNADAVLVSAGYRVQTNPLPFGMQNNPLRLRRQITPRPHERAPFRIGGGFRVTVDGPSYTSAQIDGESHTDLIVAENEYTELEVVE